MPLYKIYISKGRTDDFDLFLALSRAVLNPERMDRINSLTKGRPVDWEYISNLACRHRVLPILYRNLKLMGLQSGLPLKLKGALSRQYMLIIGDNVRKNKKLIEILNLFENQNIPAIPFKGPILAESLYDDSELRYYQDLDILVPKRDVIKARDALLQSNFSLHIKPFSGKNLRQFLKHGRECDFIDHTGTVKIDLHWQLGSPFRYAYDYDFCKNRLRVICFDNRYIHILSEEDTLLHLCINGSHDIWDNFEKILCVADFIVRHPDLDWRLAQELAAKLHANRIFLLGLFLAWDLFDIDMPSEIIEEIKMDRNIQQIAEGIYEQLYQDASNKTRIESRVTQLPYYLRVREHYIDKIIYLIKRMFIPTQKDWHNRPLMTRISFLHFLMRPLDLLIEFAKAKLK